MPKGNKLDIDNDSLLSINFVLSLSELLFRYNNVAGGLFQSSPLIVLLSRLRVL